MRAGLLLYSVCITITILLISFPLLSLLCASWIDSGLDWVTGVCGFGLDIDLPSTGSVVLLLVQSNPTY